MQKNTSFSLSLTQTLFLVVCTFFLTTARSQSGWSDLGINSGVSPSYYTPSDINSFCRDNSGNIYMGLGKGVYKWNGAVLTELGTGNKILNNNDQINSVVADGSGNIYAAGNFSNSSIRYVAKWDGTAWTSLGETNSSLNASADILSLACDKFGNIFAAGKFKNANSNYYVAKWDKALNAWSELGTGSASLKANDAINSIISDTSGNLYAAGLFTNSSGSCYVSKWNGSSWTEVSGSNSLNANGEIKVINMDQTGMLYATGRFTNSNSKRYVSRFNGITWSEVGGGSTALNASAAILSLSLGINGNIFVGGSFKNSKGTYYVSQWNGVSWNEVGSPSSSFNPANQIKSLIVDLSGNLYSSGAGEYARKYVSTWNGSEWKELADAGVWSPSSLTNVVIDDLGTAYVGGRFDKAEFQVLKWEGQKWSLTGNLNANSYIGTLKYHGGKLYANGPFTNSQGKSYVSEWNGSSWNEIGNIASTIYNGTNIRNFDIDDEDNLYVSEDFAGSSSDILKWDGNKWSALTSPNSIKPFGNVEKIIADTKNNIYLAGDFGSYGSKYLPRWDGADWEHVGEQSFSTLINNFVYALALGPSGNLYAGGIFTGANSKYFVACWNKKTNEWTQLGDFMVNDPIRSIVCDLKGNVYVAGDFTSDGRSYVAKWNGTSWAQVGLGSAGLYGSSRVNNLTIDPKGYVYATGEFVNTRGFLYVARYRIDEAQNCPLSIGADTSITLSCQSCTYDLTTLYNTSQFTNATWNTATPTSAGSGTYSFVVTDNVSNCTDTAFVFVDFRVGTNIYICPKGSASIKANMSGSSYQWQANNGSGYSNLAENENYAGTQRETLRLTSMSSSNYNTTYRCVIDGVNDIEYTLKFAVSWTGSYDNNWNNEANWACNELPDGNTDVVVSKGSVTLSSNAACRSIRINPAASLTILAGFNLNVLQ